MCDPNNTLFFRSFPRFWPNSRNQLIFVEIVFFPKNKWSVTCSITDWAHICGFTQCISISAFLQYVSFSSWAFCIFSCLECSSSRTWYSFYSIKVLLPKKKKKPCSIVDSICFGILIKKNFGFVLVVIPWFHSCGSCK